MGNFCCWLRDDRNMNEEQREPLHNKISGRQEENNQLGDIVRELNTELYNKLKDFPNICREVNHNVSSELKKMEDMIKTETDKICGQLHRELESTTNELKKLLVESNGSLQQLESGQKAHLEKFEQGQEHIEDLLLQMRTKDEKLKDAENQLDTLRGTTDQLEREIQKLKTENGRLLSENDDLHTKYMETIGISNNMKIQNHGKQTKIKELESRVSDLSQDTKEVKKDLATAREKHEVELRNLNLQFESFLRAKNGSYLEEWNTLCHRAKYNQSAEPTIVEVD